MQQYMILAKADDILNKKERKLNVNLKDPALLSANHTENTQDYQKMIDELRIIKQKQESMAETTARLQKSKSEQKLRTSIDDIDP